MEDIRGVQLRKFTLKKYNY